ncbi:MAG: 16S rRNA (adenine(1518)-N(6)/adenine(1519)-N(6))-dimethyltransferase RsmA [Gemmatimonadota bacterium]|nr:16S rRNA (adenine(1518)-N(6)/adenine(1519)-N(6))-dimethyltransferase RsmA [Gemmatimonadota bacterium]MDH3368076.1 16S rRNA (adenine(1518)-N(6)/adenine(1519)-N(6))-dimethyltransferase RsmA [Gemmatimonadota bacterium]MDH3478691.1 16S rRNA (adenine(1518)-N(6)/adenine(1519)-N(6))-dimethyltransferase RsmA [Gemmatimonadota bacterium]MDH3570928.1 16S rRNA (adenine(1518)-N(6)/adenine(1519)-N(6))-dimethyltransferase RsmA [Gemmatimonadota bacterium]MDH5548623.1 16S rRNA (adenine(1518)-N(6)/adenine(151
MGRRLGQHFLSDPSILDRIVEALAPTPHDTVIEIGPGRGTLTRRLAPRVGRVVAIERDPRLVEAMAEAALPSVEVVEGDALAVDWHRTVQGPFKVLGNIPYYITSPLIDKALEPPRPACIVFLMQREVAERLAADPGGKAYGALTVGVQALARVERLFVVPAGAFRPPPAVDSAVVRLTPLATPLVADARRQAFREFTQALFSRRRKQLGGTLRALTGREPGQIAAFLAGLGVAPAARPETLSPKAFVAMFEWVQP